jgi:hypothetical protein
MSPPVVCNIWEAFKNESAVPVVVAPPSPDWWGHSCYKILQNPITKLFSLQIKRATSQQVPRAKGANNDSARVIL